MADPERRAAPKGAKKGGKEKRLAEVRRIVAEEGLTIKDVFPGEVTPLDPATAANPCAEQSAGFLICNGSEQEVIAFPSGGPWVVQVTNGVITFANAAGVSAVERAPEPRPNGETPPPDGGQPPNLY